MKLPQHFGPADRGRMKLVQGFIFAENISQSPVKRFYAFGPLTKEEEIGSAGKSPEGNFIRGIVFGNGGHVEVVAE